MEDVTRIIVRKQDEATVVAEQLIDADTDAIVFVIPKGAAFTQSLNNFKLLKREGSVLGKEIIIESEDPLAQERAVKAGLEVGEAPVEEDEERDADADDEPTVKAVGAKLPRGRALKVKESEEEEAEPIKKISRVVAKKKSLPVEAEQVIDAEVEEAVAEDDVSIGEPVRPVPRRPLLRRGRVLFMAGLALFVVGLSYLAVSVLPEAILTVEMKKDSWKFTDSILVDKAVSEVDVAAGKIPGQIFTQKNTTTAKLPATGAEYVEQKAGGVLTVYNAYSSQPQSIVATTRFVTSDGVVFRTTKALVIPGAKIENGSIIPSSITVPVVADKAGTLANVGPTQRLTIPGFAKTPKFNGFYGELKEGATGGFIGKTKVATESDIKAAKAEGAKTAEQLVRAQIAGQIPEGFKAVDGSSRFSITRQVVDQIADASGNFTVTTEAQLSVFAFQEQDVKDFLAAKMALQTAERGDFKVDSETLKYGSLAANTVIALGGRIALPITYEAALSHRIDIDALRAAVSGKDESELSALIFGVPGVTEASAELKPFYVGSVPTKADKITITVR